MSALDKSPRILKHFSGCTDPRQHRIQHKLIDILVIAVLATLCGEDGWDGFVDWAQDKENYLRKFLLLEGGIPCADTFRRVFERLNGEEFLQAFIRWAEELRGRSSGQICIDGKALRKAAHPLHIVAAWSEANRMVIGAVNTDEKGKEIPAIEELLDLLILKKGDIVTIDAIGCQKSIVSRITKQKAEYVIALKKNQGNLFAEVENYFSQAMVFPVEAHCIGLGYREQRRGRDDIHEVWMTTHLKWLPQKEEWSGLRGVVMVVRRWVAGGKSYEERRYYITSLVSTPDVVAYLVRRHWSIENEYHWHLDVTLGEDDSAISRAANKNLRVARDIALRLLRSESTYKRGLKAKMRRCHRSESYLDQVLCAANF